MIEPATVVIIIKHFQLSCLLFESSKIVGLVMQSQLYNRVIFHIIWYLLFFDTSIFKDVVTSTFVNMRKHL